MSAVVLRQTASWNASLTNGYRTRWTEAGGRFFRISAAHLDALWDVEEVTEDGRPIAVLADGVKPWEATPADYDFGFTAYAFTLAEARELIAAEVAR